MLDKLYYLITWIIDKFGSPRETQGKESEEILKLKKFYEEQAANEKDNNNSYRT